MTSKYRNLANVTIMGGSSFLTKLSIPVREPHANDPFMAAHPSCETLRFDAYL